MEGAQICGLGGGDIFWLITYASLELADRNSLLSSSREVLLQVTRKHPASLLWCHRKKAVYSGLIGLAAGTGWLLPLCLLPSFLLPLLAVEAFKWLDQMFESLCSIFCWHWTVQGAGLLFCMYIVVFRSVLNSTHVRRQSGLALIFLGCPFFFFFVLIGHIFYCVLNDSSGCQRYNSYPRLWVHAGVSGFIITWGTIMEQDCLQDAVKLFCFLCACVYCFSSHWRDCSH